MRIALTFLASAALMTTFSLPAAAASESLTGDEVEHVENFFSEHDTPGEVIDNLIDAIEAGDVIGRRKSGRF